MALPDYPRFLLEGQAREGNPVRPVHIESNDVGILECNIYGGGWFHSFSLKITDPALAGSLYLRYKCSFVANNGQTQTSPTYENGDPCPPDASSVANVRALRIELAGAEAGNYVLKYDGTVRFKGASNPPREYVGLNPGDWLGTERPDQGASQEWVSRLKIYLRRN